MRKLLHSSDSGHDSVFFFRKDPQVHNSIDLHFISCIVMLNLSELFSWSDMIAIFMFTMFPSSWHLFSINSAFPMVARI
jgi:hypothetical protein